MELSQKLTDNSLSHVIVLKNRRHVYTPAWTKFAGQSIEHWSDNGWHKLVHPEDNEGCNEIWQKVLDSIESEDRNVPLHFDVRLKRQDGEYRYFFVKINLVEYEKESALHAEFRDITDCQIAQKYSFRDLERFIEEWKHSPKALCSFAGKAIGCLSYDYLPDLVSAIGTSYFSKKSICSRIDFLYGQKDSGFAPLIQCQKTDILQEITKVDVCDDVVCIHDISRKNALHLMLIRDIYDGSSIFSVRPFVVGGKPEGYLAKLHQETQLDLSFEAIAERQSYDEYPLFYPDQEFWNFKAPRDCALQGVQIVDYSKGFSDLKATQQVARLIIEGSNLVGWRG
jgi:hypothetical protein